MVRVDAIIGRRLIESRVAELTDEPCPFPGKPSAAVRRGCIVGSHSADNSPLYLASLSNHAAYASRHGYDLVCLSEPWQSASWGLIPYLKALLSRYQWVFLVGSDVIFTAPELTVESRLSDSGSVYCAATDLKLAGSCELNNDTLIIRNDVGGVAYLDALVSTRSAYEDHPQLAQATTLDIVNGRIKPDGLRRSDVVVLPDRVLQSLPIQDSPTTWRPGDFAIHFATGDNADKLRRVRQFLDDGTVCWRPIRGGRESESPEKVRDVAKPLETRQADPLKAAKQMRRGQ